MSGPGDWNLVFAAGPNWRSRPAEKGMLLADYLARVSSAAMEPILDFRIEIPAAKLLPAEAASGKIWRIIEVVL